MLKMVAFEWGHMLLRQKKMTTSLSPPDFCNSALTIGHNVPTAGPLPVGNYWIVDREQGGLFSQGLAASKELYNKLFRGAQFGHSDWFALYRDGIGLGDYT